MRVNDLRPRTLHGQTEEDAARPGGNGSSGLGGSGGSGAYAGSATCCDGGGGGGGYIGGGGGGGGYSVILGAGGGGGGSSFTAPQAIDVVIDTDDSGIPQIVISYSLDHAAPTASPAQEPAANNAGWNTSDVTVTWNWSDSGTGIDTANCTPSSTSSGEGTLTLNAICTDLAGNQGSASYSVKVDKTAPTVSFSGNAGTYTIDQSVNITCVASDTLSGIASSTCADISGPAYSFALGTTSRSASATDKAGNPGSGSTAFTVGVTFDSLCTLSASFSADPKIDQGLCDKLAAAKAAAVKGDTKTKTNNLNAYRQQVAAQSGKALTKPQATTLTTLSKVL